jgi:hypothetical protein
MDVHRKEKNMSEKNVCSSGWHGDHGSTVNLKNPTKNPVSVSSHSGCSWPFPNETSGFTINAGGTKLVKLADESSGPKKSYCYDTTGCPGDPRNVNPKTVIID